MTGPEEFWNATDRSGGPSSCWPWRLSRWRERRNYGQVNWRGRTRGAHIVAYELAVGPVPDGLHLDHTCHDPNVCTEPCPHTGCCNPAHLEPVTQGENNRRRSRQQCGRGHPKTPDFGKPRGTKWRCRACDTETQRARRAARRAA